MQNVNAIMLDISEGKNRPLKYVSYENAFLSF